MVEHDKKTLDLLNGLKEAKNIKTFLEGMSIGDLVNIINYTNEQYYNEGTQQIPDYIYDIIKDRLKEVDPKNELLKKVGAPLSHKNEKNKVKLPIFMGSLSKIKPIQKDIDNWQKRFNDPAEYVVSDKLDGISALLVFELIHISYDRHSTFLYTRGDGEYGQDISSLLEYIPSIKNTITKIKKNVTVSNKRFIVRGELIINKKTYDEKYKDKFSNPRNMIGGITFKLKPDQDILKDIDFVAYEIVEPKNLTPLQQFQLIQKTGFKTPFYKTIAVNQLSVEYLSNTLQNRVKVCPYEIDGLVVKQNSYYKPVSENIKWGFAFKDFVSGLQAEVVVNQIEWNLSKDGLLKPRVQFDPIQIDGVMVSNATGHNGKFVKDNSIGAGSKIVIVRSGGVIPKIHAVIAPSLNGKPQLPDKSKYNWIWNSSGVEIVAQGVEEDISYKEFEYFFLTIKIDGFSGKTIEKLYDAGFNTIQKVRNATVENVLQLEGFQHKSATKLVQNIKNRFEVVLNDDFKKVVPLLMVASNKFGNGLGIKRAKVIVEQFKEMINKREVPTKEQLIQIEGISEIIGEKIHSRFRSFYNFLTENDLQPPQFKKDQKHSGASSSGTQNNQRTDHEYYKKIFVFSGFRDPGLQTRLENEFGAEIRNTVSKHTFILVVSDPEEQSEKIKKAQKLQIQIVQKDDFIKRI